jgi:hypothetical protein
MPPIPAEQCPPWPRSAKQTAASPRRAHSIAGIVSEGPFSRTFIYEAIKQGRLKARKAGRRTVILDEDYQSFLESLPAIGEAAK